MEAMVIPGLIALAVQTATWTTYAAVNQQNNQIAYQQEVLKQNAIAAQNKAAAEMKTRRDTSLRAQAATRAQMANTGIDSSSGSFLDLVGQGAAAGELDVLKAKHDGDSQAWALNTKINELESTKRNAGLEAVTAGVTAGISGVLSAGVGSVGTSLGKIGSTMQTGWDNFGTKVKGIMANGKATSGDSGFVGVDAMEGTVA